MQAFLSIDFVLNILEQTQTSDPVVPASTAAIVTGSASLEADV